MPAKKLLSGFIMLHILNRASQEPIYGFEIQQELGRHGYWLSPGALASLLRRLEKDGYLELRSQVVDGKGRNCYAITPKGKRALGQVRRKVNGLVTGVIEEK